MTGRSILGLLLVGSLLVFGGCGGRSAKVEYVEGVLTLGGQPLEGAAITFHPKNGDGNEAAAFGHSDASGGYKLSSVNGEPERGAIAGEYVITVSKIEENDPRAGMSYEEATMSRLQPTRRELVPAVYQNRERTPLSATVNKGRNTINIELSRNP